METTVTNHQLRLVDRQQDMHRLLQRRIRDMWIDPDQGREQAIPENHLPVVGPLRVHTLGSNIRSMRKLPADFLKPANAQVFELLLVHHDCAKPRRRFIQARKCAHSRSMVSSEIRVAARGPWVVFLYLGCSRFSNRFDGLVS